MVVAPAGAPLAAAAAAVAVAVGVVIMNLPILSRVVQPVKTFHSEVDVPRLFFLISQVDPWPRMITLL